MVEESERGVESPTFICRECGNAFISYDAVYYHISQNTRKFPNKSSLATSVQKERIVMMI